MITAQDFTNDEGCSVRGSNNGLKSKLQPFSNKLSSFEFPSELCESFCVGEEECIPEVASSSEQLSGPSLVLGCSKFFSIAGGSWAL